MTSLLVPGTKGPNPAGSSRGVEVLPYLSAIQKDVAPNPPTHALSDHILLDGRSLLQPNAHPAGEIVVRWSVIPALEPANAEPVI